MKKSDLFQQLLTKHKVGLPTCVSGVGDGWIPLLDEMLTNLRATGWVGELSQVKEKLGTLRVYVSEATAEQYAIIDKAEDTSGKTCETCGKPGKMTGTGWIRTACEEHAPRSKS